MTAQEVSTILRSALNPIILLINNGAYSIEVEIHVSEIMTLGGAAFCSICR